MAVQGELGRVLCFFVVSKFRGLVDATLLADPRFTFPPPSQKKKYHILPSQLQVTYESFSLSPLHLVPHPKLSYRPKNQGTG